MIIVRFIGGLGNQLFQYALYKKLESIGKSVLADVTWYDTNIEGVQWKLPQLGINLRIATRQEIHKLADTKKNIVHLLRRKFAGTCSSYFCEKENSVFDASVFELDNVYLSGYWQTEKYFIDIRDELLTNIKFEVNQNFVDTWMGKITKLESVSIHIRRGDYLLEKNSKLLGDICTEKYYNNAIKYLGEDVQYFVFSDDPIWAKDHYFEKNFHIVSNGQTNMEISELYLMSHCKKHIIANSSFSWWGAWINGLPNKMVLAPCKWINNEKTSDIWCPDWIKISV